MRRTLVALFLTALILGGVSLFFTLYLQEVQGMPPLEALGGKEQSRAAIHEQSRAFVQRDARGVPMMLAAPQLIFLAKNPSIPSEIPAMRNTKRAQPAYP